MVLIYFVFIICTLYGVELNRGVETKIDKDADRRRVTCFKALEEVRRTSKKKTS